MILFTPLILFTPFYGMQICGGLMAQAVRHSPPTRVRILVTPCGYRGGQNGVWVGFSRVSPIFPYHKFHSTISPYSSHPFHFISSALVMVHQAWSAGTLAIHWPTISGLHRILSLDPTLSWTRVEDISLCKSVAKGSNSIKFQSNVVKLDYSKW